MKGVAAVVIGQTVGNFEWAITINRGTSDGVKVDAPGWYTGSAPFSLDSYHSELTLFGRNTTEAILTSRTGGFASGTSGFASGSSGSGGSAGGGAGGGGGGTF